MAEEFDLHELAVEDARHGHQRPKIEEYGDPLFAVLHTSVESRHGERAHHRRGRRLRRPQLRALGAPAAPSRASRTCASAPSASRELLKHGSGFVLLRADGQRGRPLLPGGRRARDRAREHRGAHLQARPRRARNIEALYDLKRKLMVAAPRGRAADRGRAASSTAAACRRCASGTQDYFRDVYDHLLRINQRSTACATWCDRASR